MYKLLALFLYLIGSTASAQELLLFGGSQHDKFLWCLTCNEYSKAAICNEFGAGNECNTSSVFNDFGTFGNEFSSSSPWNEFSTSTNVPVLIDRAGKFYGYFTTNTFRSDDVDFSGDLASIYKMANGELATVREILCDTLN